MDNWIYFNTYIASFNEINIRPLPTTFSELFIVPSTYNGGTAGHNKIGFLVPRAIIPDVNSIDQALELCDQTNVFSNILRIWSGGMLLGSFYDGYVYYDVYYR